MSQGMTPKEVATLLCCSVDQVRNLIVDGQLLATNIGRGNQRARWRILQSSLDEFFSRRANRKPSSRRKQPMPKREWV